MRKLYSENIFFTVMLFFFFIGFVGQHGIAILSPAHSVEEMYTKLSQQLASP